MNPKRNPFTLNPIDDINLLTGRHEFLRVVKEDYIFNLESFVLVGGRRSGKTSLLKSLCNDTSSNIDYLYWEVSSTEGDSWDYFNSILKERFNNNELGGSFNSPDEFFKLYSEEKGSERKLVIILDEFEVLLKEGIFSPLMFRKFRSYLTKYGNSFLSFIVSSPLKKEDLNIPEEEGSGFLNMLFEDYLPLIEKDPASFYSSYLQKFDSINKTNVLDEFNTIINTESFDKDKLYQWAGRHPYLLQLIGFDLYRSPEKSDLSLLIKRSQKKFNGLVDRWLSKKYYDRITIIYLYLLDHSNDMESDLDLNYLQAWCFITDDYKINGGAVSYAVLSVFSKIQELSISKIINNSELKEDLLESLKRFNTEEDFTTDTFSKPYFIELILNGWIRIKNNKIIKSH